MMHKISLTYLILTGILLAACTKQPQISIETVKFNFGEVINGEIVTRELTLHNAGGKQLEIESISTSCGCTRATLNLMTIPPGRSAKLHIEFDSGAHGPDLTGELTRQIFITSNDPQQPEVEIEFTALILPR